MVMQPSGIRTASQQSYAQDEQQWQKWLQDRQTQRQRSLESQVIKALQPIVDQYAPRRTTGTQTQAPRTTGTQYQPPRSTGTPRPASPAPSRSAPAGYNPSPSGARLAGVGTPGRGATPGTGPYRKYPNAWWGSVPQATLKEFADNREMVSRLWAEKNGYGDRTQNILNQWSDPTAVLFGTGQGAHMPDNPSRLDLTGQLFDRILGGGSGGNQYIDPRDITRRVVSAAPKFDAQGRQISQADPFVESIAGPGLSAPEQVQRTIQFLGASLRGLLPDDTYQAYLRLLQRQGEQFLVHAAQNPRDNTAFNKWIGARLGPNGGL